MYSFLHPCRRTTSIYRWTIGLPSVPTVPIDKVFGATLCPCNNANYLIHERILHIYRSCIHFSIRTDGQLRFTDGQLVYHRYRPYRWTRFWRATLCPCNNANYIIHERILHIYRSCIHFSIGTDGQHLLPMENWFTIGTDRTDGQGFGGLPYALAIMLTTSFTKGFCTFTDRVFISPSVPTDNFDLPMENWFTIGTDRTDGQGFLGATLCPCNNANYLIHERILHIYRSCIHFSIRTDGQLRFTDGQLVYHRYRPYRWTRFWRATLCPCNNANYIIHERILHIYRSCIHFSIGTDGQHLLPMENWFTIGTDRTDGQGFGGLPYALAIMLTTSFTKGFCTFTDRVFISPSVPTDNFDLPMENWFTIGTDRTDGQGFLGATLCPCNNANYLIHERILHIYRSCIHFSIRTDGQLRFTDGELVYHRYRPYRWTRFLGLPYALAIMLTTSFTKGFCTFTDRVFISPSVPTDNFDLPMENWFTIGTDRTDGQGFWGLPYALVIMLTTSFTKGFCTFTDRVFISASVPTDTDGRNNITKLTVGMLASVLDNPQIPVVLVQTQDGISIGGENSIANLWKFQGEGKKVDALNRRGGGLN